MKKNSQIIFMSLCLGLAFSGCTVHSDVDAGGFSPPPQKKLDAGVEGTWSTGCLLSDGAYQTDSITFHGATFEDNVAQYPNPTCSGTPFLTAKVPGTMTVIGHSFFEPTGYDVDIVMTNPNGVSETHYLITLIEGGKLYLPDPTAESTRNRPLSIDRARPYTKVGG